MTPLSIVRDAVKKRYKSGKEHPMYRHGLGSIRARNPLYSTWGHMKRRCFNKNSPEYLRYGAKGITVCERWLDFKNFLADMGGSYQKGFSLDRINNSKGYSPENCRWVPLADQNRNKTSVVLYEYKGKKLTIPQLASEIGIESDTMYARLKKYHWTLERAMTTAVPRRFTKLNEWYENTNRD